MTRSADNAPAALKQLKQRTAAASAAGGSIPSSPTPDSAASSAAASANAADAAPIRLDKQGAALLSFDKGLLSTADLPEVAVNKDLVPDFGPQLAHVKEQRFLADDRIAARTLAVTVAAWLGWTLLAPLSFAGYNAAAVQGNATAPPSASAVEAGLANGYPVLYFALGFVWLFVAAGLKIRSFMILHDCGHGSFWATREWNDKTGKLLQMLAYTPFALWRYGHNRHHLVQGNLDVLDEAATIAHTTDDWRKLALWKRVLIRGMRDPIVFMLVLLPFSWPARLCFLIQATTLYAAFAVRGVPQPFLYAVTLEFFTAWLAGITGIFLFHLQHSVNTGYRAPAEKFSPHAAAIHGSTMLRVPAFLKWLTLGIQYHHIHHLSTRVPCYRLAACHEVGQERGLWSEVNVVDGPKAATSFFNVFWDEPTHQFVTFWPYQIVGQNLGEPNMAYASVF
ncbi:hypothetical protein CAOG_08173 [Capsaspora owczarzaki ATCC 30864]|uniref:hypothetical protein n=1 Tax=Capsaspora owczarzaki (strain ATCC 30864) TaxID=595528 RepID=UPI0001FE4B50|nr:hypothetical protein CAOG_08173 [Capsaspora owczarzaki ATCC 30864]|eukprot:XP_004342774.1 hypothetical protein CAOG_08173 [Capsaspora owczarzaki ATCC 30864]